MLALNQTFDETRTVKVLVVPIGNNSLFDQHFQVVSNLRDVPFYELNRPPASGNSTTAPFKYFNWNDGNLLFDFLRYDRVLIGPGDLNNFQSSKRVLMIMGLINYPELGTTADKIEEEMEYFARRHPNILLRRLFVFNYSFDDPLAHSMVTPLMAKIRDPSSLVIFPPDGTCGNTNSSDEAEASQSDGMSMVDVHLNEVMSHAALHIVLALEQQMRLCDDARSRNTLPEGLPLCTIFDDIDENSSNNTPRDAPSSMNASKSKKMASGMYKKKPSGRIHKWQGDLCMQACTPRDALDHYTAAIADCKNLGETLWLAGALDGYAAAVLLLLQMSANIEEILGRELKSITSTVTSDGIVVNESVTEKAMRLAEDRINDAVAIYGTSIVYCALEVECLLRTARMHEHSPFHTNREAKVLEYVLRAVAVPGMNTQQQIEVTLECGLRCHRLGMWRKYALFLYIAALMSADNENYGVAHALIQYACNECGLAAAATQDLSPMQLTSVPHAGNVGTVAPAEEKLTTTTSPASKRNGGASAGYKESKDSTNTSTKQTAAATATWASLRTSLFSTAALIADEHGDPLSATQYLVALMQLIQEGEQKHAEQRKDWLRFSPRKLFTDEKLLASLGDLSNVGAAVSTNTANPTNSAILQGAKHTRTNSRTAGNSGTDMSAVSSSMERGVRWEGSNSAVPAIPEPYPAPAADRSPIFSRRPVKSEAAESLSSAGVAMDAEQRYQAGGARPPFSPIAPRRLALGDGPPPAGNSAPSSYTGEADRERDMNRYRSQLGGGSSTQEVNDSAAEARPMITAQSSNGSIGRPEGRRLAVPALPERLNSLSHLTHTTATASRTNFEPGSAAAVAASRNGWQGDFLIDRFLRSLSQQEGLLGSSGFGLASGPSTGDKNAGNDQTSAAFAADALDVVAQLLSASKYPLELQEETHGLFARLSKSIAPCSWIPLPVSMLSVRPVALQGCRRPVLLVTPALTTARKNLLAHKDLLARKTGSAGEGTGSDEVGATDTASSLFYDPFAAKRQKALTQAQKAEVLWAVGQECKFVAVFSNPLGVPVFLSAVFPVLQGAEHTVYPISVHIPPYVETFEVELLLMPKAAGVLDVVGVQFIANNATHLLRVDKEGRSTDLPEQTVASKKQESTLTAAATGAPTAVPTNTITVVPAALPLKLLASWDSSSTRPSAESTATTATAAATTSAAASTVVDLATRLSIFPGEARAEQLYLQVEGLPSLCRFFDELLCETHFKVTVREHCESSITGAKPVTCIIMDYTGPLGNSDASANTTSCSLVSSVHNSVPCSPSHESGAANTSSLLTSLSLLFAPTAAVSTLDVEVEVCSAPKRVMDTIHCFRSAAGADPDAAATVGGAQANDKDRLAQAVEASELTLYARCYSVRVQVQHTAGVSVSQLSPLQSAVIMPVPNYEITSLRGALDGLLSASSALRRDLISDGLISAADVKIVPTKLGVLLEVSNRSDWWAFVGVSRAQIVTSTHKQLQYGSTAGDSTSSTTLFGTNFAPQHEQLHTIDASAVADLDCSLLQLPPHSSRSVVIQYSMRTQEATRDYQSQQSPLQLLWGVLDLSRSGGTLNAATAGESGVIDKYLRFGALPAVTREAPGITGASGTSGAPGEGVRLTSLGQDIAPLLQAIPAVEVCTRLLCKTAVSTTSSTTETAPSLSAPQATQPAQALQLLQPHLSDALRGDLYSISSGKFYDLQVALHTTRPGIHAIEVAVVIVCNDVPVLRREAEAGQKVAINGAAVAGALAAPTYKCVMTGKPYCRYTLAADAEGSGGSCIAGGSGGGATVMHSMRLCFPFAGSCTVCALARVLPQSPNNTTSNHVINNKARDNDWWTCAGGYFRVVIS